MQSKEYLYLCRSFNDEDVRGFELYSIAGLSTLQLCLETKSS